MPQYEGYILNFDFKFAMFKKPYATSSQSSFFLPPLSTFKGMLASILGIKRDSYYELFENCKFGFKLNSKPIKISLNQNLVDTSQEYINKYGKGLIQQRNPTKVEIVYNLNFDAYVLFDDLTIKELKDRLDLLDKSKLVFNVSGGRANLLGKYRLMNRSKFKQIEKYENESVMTAVNPNINHVIPAGLKNSVVLIDMDIPASFIIEGNNRKLLSNKNYEIYIPVNSKMEINSGPIYVSENNEIITCIN